MRIQQTWNEGMAMIGKIRRSVLAIVTVAGVVAGGLASTSTPAVAHTKLSPFPTCSGSEVGHYHTHSSLISVFVSFSTADGGTNCVWAQKQTNRGVLERMNIVVYRCATGSPSNPCSWTAFDDDLGPWEFYAGPVEVDGTSGHCIMVRVFYRTIWSPDLGPFHCG